MTQKHFSADGFSFWFIRQFLMILPLLLPGMYLISNYFSSEENSLQGMGKGLIALPFHGCSQVDLLIDWDCLGSCEDKGASVSGITRVPAKDLPPEDIPTEIQEHSVSVYGYIFKDDVRIYCLYDALEKRWFRLPVGQVDELSKFKAEWSDEDGFASLTHLETGIRYLIKPGERKLERVVLD